MPAVTIASGRSADSGERQHLVAVAAAAQPDDQPVPDRDNVICPVVGPPVPVLIHPWRPHHQYHLVAGDDDLLNLCPQPQVRLAAQRLSQLLHAGARPRGHIADDHQAPRLATPPRSGSTGAPGK